MTRTVERYINMNEEDIIHFTKLTREDIEKLI